MIRKGERASDAERQRLRLISLKGVAALATPAMSGVRIIAARRSVKTKTRARAAVRAAVIERQRREQGDYDTGLDTIRED